MASGFTTSTSASRGTEVAIIKLAILAFNVAITWLWTLFDLFGDHQSEISKTF